MKINHSKLKSFFIGTLLGDSYIYYHSLYCKQVSKDLIYFKAKFIKKHLPNAIVQVSEHKAYTDKNGVNHQQFWTLCVKPNKYIRMLEKIFYPEGKKIYPKGCILKLDALGFAMWYADDGTTILVQNGARRRVQICTDGFTALENDQIKQDFESLGYKIKIVDRARKGQKRVQLNDPILYQSFMVKIHKYFYKYFPSLLYKIDLGYRQFEGKKIINDYRSCYLLISTHPEFKNRIR